MRLSAGIEQLPNVGPGYQRKLKRLGIKTIGDILFHFPHRYEDFSNITPISELTLDQNFCIRAQILSIKNSRTSRKKMTITEAVVKDDKGSIRVVWFRQPYLIKVLKLKGWVYLAGKVAIGKDGLYLSNPVYEKVEPKSGLVHTARVVPIYPETEGLSSRWLRYIIKPLLDRFIGKIPETLPEKIRKKHHLLGMNQALAQIHFPDSMAAAKKAQFRFQFEELFLIELFVLKQRMRMKQEKAVPIALNISLVKRFIESLPFKLTNAQRKSVWQILKDLERPHPMSRLLEGDVGSGKTVVAATAALEVARAGYQVAFMAPTEVLAQQHFREIQKLLANFRVDIGLLTGKEDKLASWKLKNQVLEISREKILEKTIKGSIDILIGTHALIQSKVLFSNLGLVVVDEQHRFGVEQRAALSHKTDAKEIRKINAKQILIPHLLSMTATPIPRTLALTVYGDLDLSVIDELPKGRKRVITKVVAPSRRLETYDFIREQVRQGKQAFVICPRIESAESEDDSSWADVKAVETEYEKLSKKVFPNLSIGILHGKLSKKQKEKVMEDFKAGKIDILVSTSVVEVGIDVPRATVMMIEGAERFGLAQLYQFRGRVGRSAAQSYCFLFTNSGAKKTRQRLRALLGCESGFELAKKDLEIRGPGDFFGQRQWGIPDIAMQALSNALLVENTRQSAKEILMEDPTLKKYPLLARRLDKFEERVHLE